MAGVGRLCRFTAVPFTPAIDWAAGRWVVTYAADAHELVLEGAARGLMGSNGAAARNGRDARPLASTHARAGARGKTGESHHAPFGIKDL